MEIKKVTKFGNKQKIVTIPAKSDIQVGDYVKIIKIKEEEEDKRL
ncbi:MAG: hypothetical protein ACTSXD_05125 [Candidatus Heimdallarchaeaceae archaeon]